MFSMFFSSKTILKKIKEKRLSITPFKQEYLGPVSYEMHLGDLMYKVEPISKEFDGSKLKERELKQIQIMGGYYILSPHEFIIAKTIERIFCDKDTMALYDGKASLAQIGLFTNISSMLVEPGTDTNITCEIFNASNYPIKLVVGQKMGQIFFCGVI